MVIGRLRQSFAFHASPETFITGSLLGADGLSSENIGRAQILNRDVHIVSSYNLSRDILLWGSQSTKNEKSTTISVSSNGDNGMASNDRNPPFAAGPAYKELMADFFPPPNVLLDDGDIHKSHKASWLAQIDNLPQLSDQRIRQLARRFVETQLRDNAEIDLYDTLKTLAWQLLLGVVLGLDEDNSDDSALFSRIERDQEALLRGQFSLFPVSLSTPVWQSARSRGVTARNKLQTTMKDVLATRGSRCPVATKDLIGEADTASHCLLFTSSIAVKALASLLTACTLNAFVMSVDGDSGNRLVDMLATMSPAEQAKTLTSIIKETERLSPPVIGVMRRVQEDVILKSVGEDKSHSVLRGHDVWLYFVGASRDPQIFNDPDRFQFDRYSSDETPEGFAFGAGNKTCLGSALVRQIVHLVLEELVGKGLRLEGRVNSPGVKGWLGWQGGSRAHVDFGKDTKQLPTQRPREALKVRVRRAQHT